MEFLFGCTLATTAYFRTDGVRTDGFRLSIRDHRVYPNSCCYYIGMYEGHTKGLEVDIIVVVGM